jgi:hypothetical protein
LRLIGTAVRGHGICTLVTRIGQPALLIEFLL